MSYFTFLRTFITVYRSGSYNKASRQLNLTQPAISKQISSLEQQMGKQLFRRNGNGKGLEPTRIADELASSLAHHIDSIEVIFNQSRATSEDMEGTVHIGGPKEFINAKMIPAFASLAEHNIKTVLQVSSPNKVHELIQEDILDLAITERFVENSSVGYRKIYQCVNRPYKSRHLAVYKTEARRLRCQEYVTRKNLNAMRYLRLKIGGTQSARYQSGLV